MKQLLMGVAIIAMSRSSAQPLPDSVSLRKYCPDATEQYKATCFAYAPTYTALTITYCILNNITSQEEVNENVFSSGFVASMTRKYLSPFPKTNIYCGRYGTLEKSIRILFDYGAPLKKEFDCSCCSGLDSSILALAARFKVKDTSKIVNDQMAEATAIKNIKIALAGKQPVIAAINETDWFYDNEGYAIHPGSQAGNPAKDANHVVTIIGYNDHIAGGSFLIKNNWKWWGKSGFSWIPYRSMFKVIDLCYTFKL